MEDQCNSFYSHNQGVQEYLKHSLMYTTLELENTIFSAHEELAKKDEELMNLKILLNNITKERDDAMSKCQRLMLEKLQSELTGFSEDEPPSSSAGIYFSDSDDNVVSAMSTRSIIEDMTQKIEPKKPLPEKGKFLQAVMEAGPLLQTLLVSGSLPQWQHPPPHLGSVDIPPVILSSTSLQYSPEESSPPSATQFCKAASARRKLMS